MEIETQCLYAGYSPKNGEPQTLPICQSTTFKYESTEQVSKLFDLEEAGFFYTRLGNPTVDAVEQKITSSEATDRIAIITHSTRSPPKKRSKNPGFSADSAESPRVSIFRIFPFSSIPSVLF